MRFIAPAFAFIASPAFAEAFQRPIPQAQSATAEFWFAMATIALCAALAVVGTVVARR